MPVPGYSVNILDSALHAWDEKEGRFILYKTQNNKLIDVIT